MTAVTQKMHTEIQYHHRISGMNGAYSSPKSSLLPVKQIF